MTMRGALAAAPSPTADLAFCTADETVVDVLFSSWVILSCS